MLHIWCSSRPQNQFYILLKGHKLPFEKLDNNSKTSHTPLGGLGIRKDTFLKGILERKCTQTIPMVPPTKHVQDSAGQPLEKWRCLPSGEGREARVSNPGVTQETERKVGALKSSPGHSFPAAENRPRESLAETQLETASCSHSTRFWQWEQCGSQWQASHRDKHSKDLTGWVARPNAEKFSCSHAPRWRMPKNINGKRNLRVLVYRGLNLNQLC